MIRWDFKIEVGNHVIVETARGIEYGKVVQGVQEKNEEDVIMPLKPVIRVATEEDDKIAKQNKDNGKEAFLFVKRRLKNMVSK